MPLKKDDDKKEDFAPTFPDKNKPENRIYWAKASGLSIANFQKEVREGNAIVQPEGSLYFKNHIKMTNDPKVIEFIESSQAFNAGRVQRVNSLKEAHELTAKVNAMRKIRELTSTVEDVSPTVGRR